MNTCRTIQSWHTQKTHIICIFLDFSAFSRVQDVFLLAILESGFEILKFELYSDLEQKVAMADYGYTCLMYHKARRGSSHITHHQSLILPSAIVTLLYPA